MERKAPQQLHPAQADHLLHYRAIAPQLFPALDAVTRPAVDTAAAAYYLNRRPQTLRTWACFENGPIRPMRINGRLAWRVADIRQLMGV